VGYKCKVVITEGEGLPKLNQKKFRKWHCKTIALRALARGLLGYSRLLFREGSRATNGDVVFLLDSELVT
jgi:hypothetical protein